MLEDRLIAAKLGPHVFFVEEITHQNEQLLMRLQYKKVPIKSALQNN